MKFFTDRILTTKAGTPQEAVDAAKEQKPNRSLDDILADIQSGKQVKTASSNKTAAKEAECAACVASEGKKEDEKKKEEEVEVEELDEKKASNLFEEKKTAAPAAPKTAGKKTVTLKVAKSADFRQWEAEDVVKAWQQHGSIEKCQKNVQKLVSDPKTYCGLLQVASAEAGKMVKAAASQPKAEQKAAVPAIFRKFAKLPDKEKSRLREYWTELYGSDYVEAMLGEYAD